MDDKSHQLLQELVNLQKKQNDLLGRHLTRIKFSLWSLFLLMTFICLGLGGAAFVSLRQPPRSVAVPGWRSPNPVTRRVYVPAPSDGTTANPVSPSMPEDDPFRE
jgi:hypothetical protein